MKSLYIFSRWMATQVLLVLGFAMPLTAQIPLWGLTSAGGQGAGTLVRVNNDGTNFSSVPFPSVAGSYPLEDLLKAANGKFYGTTSEGGDSNEGTLFEYDPATNGYQVLYHFSSASGRTPKGSLTEVGGKLYGMASSGGLMDFGVVFEYDPTTSAYSALHDFDDTQGATPEGSLAEHNGKLYGMTSAGGASFGGVLFEYDPAMDIYAVLHEFDATGGDRPLGNLIASGGKFYGMTSGGGASFSGTLFEYDPVAATPYSVLHEFDGINGGVPQGSPLAFNGKLYGVTLDGGANFSGVLFEYDPVAATPYSVLHEFDGGNGGAFPYGNLAESGGKLYGMTSGGGANFIGVLFEYDPAGATPYSVLHEFDGPATGAGPYGSVIVSGGKLYGMTFSGGSSGVGTLFEYDLSGGPLTRLLSFSGTPIGSAPQAALTRSGDDLYGMTRSGGSNDYGTIFKYGPVSGSPALNTLHEFDLTTGGSPSGSLTLLGGKFYGLTSDGGANNSGVLFEYDPAGPTYTVLHDFDDATGSAPKGSLISVGGALYGMASNGGTNGFGAIFKYDPAGPAYTVLHEFDQTNGAFPSGDLIEWNGKLYGMATNGGTADRGILFEYDLAPLAPTPYMVLQVFLGGNGDGAAPYGSLLQYGGKFYGMTRDGGTSDVGVLFEYDPAGSGTYAVRYHFSNATGESPYGSLVEAGGQFYGTTALGGSADKGVLFGYDPAGAGTYTVLKELDGPEGEQPFGALLAFCTAPTFSACPTSPVTVNTASGQCDAEAAYTVTAVGEPTPTLTYQFSGATDGDGTGSGETFEKGNTTVTVTANNGCSPEATCTFTVTVKDNQAPTLTCPDNTPINTNPGASCQITIPNYITTLSPTDNCTAPANIVETQSIEAGAYSVSGDGATVTVHYTATDDASPANTKACTVTITVNDNEAPTVTCPPNTAINTNAGAPCQITIPNYVTTLSPTDNCTAPANIVEAQSIEAGAYSVSGDGATVMVNYTATDGAVPANTKICTVTITVNDNDAPTVTCPDNTTINTNAGASCQITVPDYVALLGPTDNCTASGNILEAQSIPAGAYGVSGHGATVTVNYTATDGASPANTKTCTVAITVQDVTPPTVNCPANITASAATNACTAAVTFTATGTDNCGTAAVTYSPVSGSIFNVGTTTVTATVTNAAGLSANCTFTVSVTCQANLSGRIIWKRNTAQGVKDVTVALTGDQTGSAITPLSGMYAMISGPGANFEIKPTKNLNKLNGVNAQDVFRINQHAATTPVPLTDLYDWVAADVNGNNIISPLDANIIQLSLLGNPQALAQWTTSWRFIPTTHVLSNPPWGFPEKIALSNISSNTQTGKDFYGIKVGDVVSAFANPANAGQGQPLVLRTPDQTLQTGQTIGVTLAADPLADLAALQFALGFDPGQLQLESMETLDGLPLQADNFGTHETELGKLRFLWAASGPTVSLKQTASLFRLRFKVLESGRRLSEVLYLDDEALPGHVYNAKGQESGVSLRFNASTATGAPSDRVGLQLLQNQPNPFLEQTTIAFVLPEACEARLRIVDAGGRVVAERKQQYASGKHSEVFVLEGMSGVLYYELSTPFGVMARKMVVLTK